MRTNRAFMTRPIAAGPASMPLGEAFGHAIGGGTALALGAGVFLLLSQKADPAEEAAVRLFGAFFALFGLMFIRLGLQNGFAVLGARKRERAVERWQRDWTWTREAPATEARVLPQIITLVIYVAIVAPFNFIWTAPWLLFRIVVGVLDLIALALLVELLRRLLQWLRFGRATVTWRTFPAIVGGHLEGFVQTARRVSDRPAKLTLNAVQEVGQKPSTKPDNATELWAETLDVRGREGRYDFSFKLPKDVFTTRLAALSPRYWKLTVAIPTPGPDFGCEFLAPVYGVTANEEREPGPRVEAPRSAVASPGPVSAVLRTLTLSTLIFGLLGIALAWIGGGLAYQNWRIWDGFSRTDGVVARQSTRVSQDSDGRSTTMYAAVVRYEVEGRGYETTQQVTSGSPMFATGARVPVIYDPSNPADGRLAGVLEFFFMPGIVLVFSLACFLAAAAGRAMRARVT